MKTELTNLILIYKDDEFLFLKRTRSTYRGITFPGGHVEDGETILDSVKREAFEETGLILNNVEFVDYIEWNSDDNREISFLYKCNDFTGVLKNSFEGEVFFSKLNQIDRSEWSSGFDLILKKYKMYE